MFLSIFLLVLGVLSTTVDYFQFYQFGSMNRQCSGYPTGKEYYVKDECYGYNYNTTDLSLKFQLASTTSANMTIYAGSTCDWETSTHEIPFICLHPNKSNDEQWQFYNGQMVTARTYGGSDCSDASAIIATNSFKPADCIPYQSDNSSFSLTRRGVGWPTKNTKGFMLNFMGPGVQLTAYSSPTCNPISVIRGATLDFNLNKCTDVDEEDSIMFIDYSNTHKSISARF